MKYSLHGSIKSVVVEQTKFVIVGPVAAACWLPSDFAAVQR